MTDPFIIPGPTLWSFSGGRTSAYMLWRGLQAYGGTLPEDHVVIFANTGKEREETLRFVHECATRWSVKVHWLEWRNAKPCFEEVGYNSAARNGEPFAALIAKKKYLPNAVTRFCTQELKIRTMRDFCLPSARRYRDFPATIRASLGLVGASSMKARRSRSAWRSASRSARARRLGCGASKTLTALAIAPSETQWRPR